MAVFGNNSRAIDSVAMKAYKRLKPVAAMDVQLAELLLEVDTLRTDLAVQKWLHELQKENMELSQTNDALQDVQAKYKASTGGVDMTKEQIQAYKKKGDTPYYEFGSNKNQKKEEQVAQTLDLKETVDELANLSDEDLQRVSASAR